MKSPRKLLMTLLFMAFASLSFQLTMAQSQQSLDSQTLFKAQTQLQIIEIEDIVVPMEKGMQGGIQVLLPGVSIEAMVNLWRDYLHKARLNTVQKKHTQATFFTNDARLPTISDHTIDLYSYFESGPKGVYLRAFFDLGGTFIEPTAFPKQHEKSLDFLLHFAIQALTIDWKSQLRIEESQLQQLANERRLLKQGRSKLEKELNDLKTALLQAEKQLVQHQEQQVHFDKATYAQIQKVERLKLNMDALKSPEQYMNSRTPAKPVKYKMAQPALKMTDTESYAPNTNTPKTYIASATRPDAAPASPIAATSVLQAIEKANYLSAIEKEMIKEINLFRSNPKGYIAYIKAHVAVINSKKQTYGPLSNYNEDIMAAEELIQELEKVGPLSMLRPHKGVYKAARSHGQDIFKRGSGGHQGSDGSFPWDRVRKYAKDLKHGNENLVAGKETARQALILLLVDAGIEDRGHRKVLLDPSWNYIACYYLPQMNEFKHYWVQNFGK